MIDKETANALALEAYLGLGKELISGPAYDLRLCNLAIAHAQKDAGKILITPGGGAPGDPCGILAAKDAEPVAWMDMVTVNLVREGINKHKARELANHFYTHQPDDTALLRMALEALDTIYASTHPYREDGSSTLSTESVELSNAAITALRERLGEKA